MLLISAPQEAGFLGRGFVTVVDVPPMDWVSRLEDGTLVGRVSEAGVIYLATGTGAKRQWIRIVLSHG